MVGSGCQRLQGFVWVSLMRGLARLPDHELLLHLHGHVLLVPHDSTKFCGFLRGCVGMQDTGCKRFKAAFRA